MSTRASTSYALAGSSVIRIDVDIPMTKVSAAVSALTDCTPPRVAMAKSSRTNRCPTLFNLTNVFDVILNANSPSLESYNPFDPLDSISFH